MKKVKKLIDQNKVDALPSNIHSFVIVYLSVCFFFISFHFVCIYLSICFFFISKLHFLLYVFLSSHLVVFLYFSITTSLLNSFTPTLLAVYYFCYFVSIPILKLLHDKYLFDLTIHVFSLILNLLECPFLFSFFMVATVRSFILNFILY
jgi:hypothetical protein